MRVHCNYYEGLPSSCIMQGIMLLWSSSSSWVFTKFDHIITRIRRSEDDIQYRLISTFRYTFLFLLFLYIMDRMDGYICYSIFFYFSTAMTHGSIQESLVVGSGWYSRGWMEWCNGIQRKYWHMIFTPPSPLVYSWCSQLYLCWVSTSCSTPDTWEPGCSSWW